MRCVGTLELLRSGRIGADFWEWRVGAPFKFRGAEDAEEGPHATAATADKDDAAAAANGGVSVNTDNKPASGAPVADAQTADGMAQVGKAESGAADDQTECAAEAAVSLTVAIVSLRHVMMCCAGLKLAHLVHDPSHAFSYACLASHGCIEIKVAPVTSFGRSRQRTSLAWT